MADTNMLSREVFSKTHRSYLGTAVSDAGRMMPHWNDLRYCLLLACLRIQNSCYFIQPSSIRAHWTRMTLPLFWLYFVGFE